ncbi:MAG: tRNA preQ1(34) S-adenosylmethionine ribosyltransferase-isomerase QueA [Candidatus Atribacteria bacterium]|nr:tRNA preQ1(34) S-adenosylmethionine ribosyltransferase-isomerase QueA [Candidatus Atribacteria bacterium]
MDIKVFDYDLPPGYIAQEPLAKRDHSQLMVLDREKDVIEHRKFYDIINFLKTGDLLVLNNSKVLPVRLLGRKKNSGGHVEVLLISRNIDNQWKVLLKPGKRIHPGVVILFSPQLEGEVVGKDEQEGMYLMNMRAEEDFYEVLYKIGKMPTPPYIKKDLTKSSLYQTVYALNEGSIAAPTAGFHFTKELLDDIGKKGVKIVFLTLHIGRGTFEMMRTSQVENHKMKSEIYTISSENAAIINQAIQEKRRIIGVGTSVTRALESSAVQKQIKAGTFWTDLFIYPGYQFQIIQALITNFHLPRSTPLMLASAFAGKEKLLNAYRIAVQNKYRFYSFGDAMFIK